jgi:hypothetical protein
MVSRYEFEREGGGVEIRPYAGLERLRKIMRNLSF